MYFDFSLDMLAKRRRFSSISPFMLKPKQKTYLVFKRIIDIFGSLLGIIVLSPIILLTLIITSCTSKGGPFFIQERLGRHKKVFHMIKFRSMKKDAKQVAPADMSSSIFSIQSDCPIIVMPYSKSPLQTMSALPMMTSYSLITIPQSLKKISND